MISCLMLFYRFKLQTPIPTYKYISTTATIVKHSLASDLVASESNAVVKVFQDFGFPESHITRILSKQPDLLKYHPQKYLKPKLDFLFSITCSRPDVVSIVTKNPFIFTRSLNNHLLPFFNSLKFVAGSHKNAAAVIKCNPFMLSFCCNSYFVENVEFLQTLGVHRNQILKMITKYGQSVGVNHEKFCRVVLRVKEMGFDLSSSYFREAVLCLSYLTESAWESRCEIYRSFGLSDHDIITMFKKQPVIMSFSEKRIREMLDFFVLKLRWTPSRLSAAPNVFLFSLEKRIIPRCSVLQALVSNKCSMKGFMLPTILKMDESRFFKSFVTRYKDIVPEVMDAYQGKLTFHEYNFESESKGKFKIINSDRTISIMATTNSIALTTPLLSNCVSTAVLQNIEFLQKLGVPQIQIMKLITSNDQSIGGNHGKFCKVVLKVKDMGFDLSSSYFLDAVRSLSFLSDLAWESRCEMFKSFGFSDHDIISMVKKQPAIILYSEKRMRDLLEFFVQKLRWSATKLSTTPNILRYSLEKRIIPRCSVLQALVLNNCNSKRLLLTYVMTMTESRFLESFVTAYKDEAPEVMDAYQGKLRFDEYNFE